MRAPRDELLEVATPEGVSFSMPLAGLVSRFLAWSIDTGVIAAILIVIGSVLPFPVQATDLGGALLIVGAFVVLWGYQILLEWLWQGQSVGKWAMGLRVVDAQGLSLQFSQVVMRNLLRAVDFMPSAYFLGGTSLLLSRMNQRLGDIAANTIVIRRPDAAMPNLDRLETPKFNSLRSYPHIEARLRQQVTAEAAALAVDALLRRDSLEAEARVRLFEALAAYYKSLVAIPSEALVGVTDEQFVRNVVDSVFRKVQEKAARAGARDSAA